MYYSIIDSSRFSLDYYYIINCNSLLCFELVYSDPPSHLLISINSLNKMWPFNSLILYSFQMSGKDISLEWIPLIVSIPIIAFLINSHILLAWSRTLDQLPEDFYFFMLSLS